jgi:flagellar protein FlgJ
MLDTQIAGQLSGLPGGLSDVIMRQLERQMGLNAGPIPSRPRPTPRPSRWTGCDTPKIPEKGAAGFVQQHSRRQGRRARTGIPAAFMVAQAAHETGWGRKEIRHADGTPGAQPVRHQGRRGLERAGGRGHHHRIRQRPAAQGGGEVPRLRQLRRVVCRLRQADEGQPALPAVVARPTTPSGFAQGLQKAGYATDPAYADKLTRVINTTLRLQRARPEPRRGPPLRSDRP